MRSALLFGLIVMVLVSITFGIIYIQNAWFRRDEFEIRLKQRAESVYKLLFDDNQIDTALLQLIDRNTLNSYNEKILIFNRQNQVIYSSSGEKTVTLSEALFKKIRQRQYVFHTEKKIEAVGIFMNNYGESGIVIASGFDKYGRRKLNNLFSILGICWLGSIFLTGLLSYIYVKGIFKPLDVLNTNIRKVAEGNLTQRIEVDPANDELTIMAQNFNKMLDRLQQSFEIQKNFLQHASHELRTPLSNLLLQTEAALDKQMENNDYREVLLSMYDDQKFLIDMVNGILSLSKYQQLELAGKLESFRADELLFEVAEEIKTYHPEFNIQIDFLNIPSLERDIMISGVSSMIKIAFTNLIRNGCTYSTNKSVSITISTLNSQVLINFFNDGPIILPEERNKLFMPFFRGSNVSQKRGHGLGLSISKRIIDVHNGQLFYTTNSEGLNCFTVLLFNF